MKEISLHIMDIVQNSISAGANLIGIMLEISRKENTVVVTITDNGKGMSEEMLENVTSPFVTTRTTRRVGLGISLFAAGAENTGGSFQIKSKLGQGTVVRAVYVLGNIDRPPIGDFSGTVHTIVVCNTGIDFEISVTIDDETQTLDTREIRQVLGDDIPLDMPDVSMWIKENLNDVFKPEYAEC